MHQLPNDQFVVTIPRALVQASGITKGQEMEWVIENGNLILLRVED